MRCGGRLVNADIPESTKHPVLLKTKHHLTLLIVRECHETVKHSGVKERLTKLLSRFWIVRTKSFVCKLLHKCIICRRFNGRPYQQPPPPPLPTFRVTDVPPFTYTGIDFAGPFYINSTENHKVWISLYTYCVVREAHLELLPHLTAQAFLRCFKRFIARRGFLCKIISDNAKTFKSAKKAILTILDNPIVHQYFSDVQMEWYFDLGKAPWWGGFF